MAAVFPPYVCRNPACKNYGQSHPNCKCGPPAHMSEGGFIDGEHFCSKHQVHNSKCQHFAEGGEIEANLKFAQNPRESLTHYALHQGLLGQLTKLGRKEDIEHYVKDTRKGSRALDRFSFSEKQDEPEANKEERHKLKEHLDTLQANPHKLLELGGNLSEVLPDHAVALAAHTAHTLNYIDGIKPKNVQNAPLDAVNPPSKAKDRSYDRQLDIIQNPLLVLKHAKNGTLQSKDLQTLHSVYPLLGTQIADKVRQHIIDAKTNGKDIPYHQKRSLSMLMGEPLQSTMTPASMQAIIQSQAPKQQPQPNSKSKGPKKATGVELKQINKVNSLYETPLQSHQTDRKS